MAGPDQQDVPFASGDALRPLRGFELVAEDMLTGFKPRNRAKSGNIKQYAPAHKPVIEGFD